MDTKDKKKEIIQTLQTSNDEELIQEVYELLCPNAAIEKFAIKSLPQELQTKVKRAIDDYKNGRYVTHTQMKQKVEQWLTN